MHGVDLIGQIFQVNCELCDEVPLDNDVLLKHNSMLQTVGCLTHISSEEDRSNGMEEYFK